MDWGLLDPLSVMVIAAARGPILVGVNTALILHCACGGRVEQSLFWEKSVAFFPVITMLPMFRLRPLTFVRFTVCSRLVLLTNWSAKIRPDCESETMGICSRTPVFP